MRQDANVCKECVFNLSLSLLHTQVHVHACQYTHTHTFFRCYHFYPITENASSTFSNSSHLEVISTVWCKITMGEGGYKVTGSLLNLILINEGVVHPVVHNVGCHNAISLLCSRLSPGEGDASRGDVVSSNELRWAAWSWVRWKE